MRKKKQQTQQSDDADDDSDNSKIKIDFHRPKIDRILKENNINLKKIIINVSITQYPVVSQVAEELDWKIQTDPEAGDWDIFWSDFSIEPDVLIRMHLHQKINHYPGIYVIARKNLLGLNLMAMRNKFPQQYNFFPLTWMLPSQYTQFRMYYQNIQKGKVRTYIVKPEAQCQGRGIFLTRNIEDLQNGSHYVIQRYITKPYLIDGLKFDFRIYVLLAGTDPLRVFLYEEGLARFATQPYIQPNSNNLDQNFIHLTNYAINKLNPKFIFNKGVNDMSSGHKRSLTSVYKILEKKGENLPLLKNKIKDIIIKTLITSNPSISHQYRYSQPQEYSGNMCFHILGFDILLTSNCQPLLLQVNHTPSFTTDTPLDTFIKHNLIKDTLILMNINLKTKSTLYKKAKILNNQRLLTGKRQIFQGQAKQKQIQKAQKQRQQYELQHLGRYQKIHPVQDVQRQNKYKQLYQFAQKSYLEQNTIRAKLQERQAKKMMKQQQIMYKQKKLVGKKQQKSQKLQKIEKSSKNQKDDKVDNIIEKTKKNEKSLLKSQKHESFSKIDKYSNNFERLSEKTSQLMKSKQHSKKIRKQFTNQTKSNSTPHSQIMKSKDRKLVSDQILEQKGIISNQKIFLKQLNLHQMIRMTKQSIKQIRSNKIYEKYSNYEKYSKVRILLPNILSDQKTYGQQKEVTENKKQQDSKKINRIDFNIIKNDERKKFLKIKKLQQQANNNLKNWSNKNGNFVMPKIFDINVQQKSQEKSQFQLIKINPIANNKFSFD